MLYSVVINELGKDQILLGLISTETVNSTVKVACEGLKAVIRRKLGDTSRLTRQEGEWSLARYRLRLR